MDKKKIYIFSISAKEKPELLFFYAMSSAEGGFCKQHASTTAVCEVNKVHSKTQNTSDFLLLKDYITGRDLQIFKYYFVHCVLHWVSVN